MSKRRLILKAVVLMGFGFAAKADIQNTEPDTPNAKSTGQTGQETRPATDPATTNLAAASPDRTNGLHMNFHGAPLSLVLDYLSEAAGFIINQPVEVKGKVDVWSKEPLTAEEAVRLLNSVLKRNGYAVLREGRILTVTSLETAKTSDLEVTSGNDPEQVQKSDEVVTQIIPVRYANAAQLINNLQVLLPSNASLSANESANSLILVATKTDIRRMLHIISALDSSIASVSSIRVFALRYAAARQLATVIQQLFPSQGSSQNAGQNARGMNGRGQFFDMAGGGFGPAGFGGPPGGNSDRSDNTARNSEQTKVVAVADEGSNLLIVSSPPDLLTTIGAMVEQIDKPFKDVTELRVFPLRNADAAELAAQLALLFPDESKSSSNQGQDQGQGPIQFAGGPGGQPPGPGGFGGGPPFGAGSDQNSSGTSARAKKQGQLIAVADPRSSSLLVSAASALMPQVEKMIEELDNKSVRKEIVKVWDLHNADPKDINRVLQDLFNRNSTMRNASSSANRNSLLGDNNALSSRETQQQQTTTTTTTGSSPGNSGGRGGTGVGGP
jgi:general secretion pathway protein D